jgi:bifunctional DNA-binding transcriptional regulator/antitoxin component of YhaV-PrlF toxin-antitoxin module
MCLSGLFGDIMGIIYSIPVKVVSNNGALKCTIPKEIATHANITKGERVIWILHDDGRVEVKPESKIMRDDADG